MPKKKRYLPAIYVDEHIKPHVMEAFRERGFQCIEISKTKKYAERDERDYITEIYAEGRVFATGDLKFIDDVLENKKKHAGIVVIPPKGDVEEDSFAAGIQADILKGFIENDGRNALRRLIFYTAAEGFRLVNEKGVDVLLYSSEQIAIDNDLTDY